MTATGTTDQAAQTRSIRGERPVPFEDVMAAVGRWMVATEALAAAGAELALAGPQDGGDPDVTAAVRGVSAAAGLPPLGELPPPQRETVAALIRMCLRQAQDLVDDPGRPPGWTFIHPDILTGWGRGSAMVPGLLAAAAPQFTEVRSFLDVGTGVGLLAIAAARTWPAAAVTGIDVWEPALEMAAWASQLARSHSQQSRSIYSLLSFTRALAFSRRAERVSSSAPNRLGLGITPIRMPCR